MPLITLMGELWLEAELGQRQWEMNVISLKGWQGSDGPCWDSMAEVMAEKCASDPCGWNLVPGPSQIKSL